MVKKVRQSVTGKYKPKIKKALTKNEQVRSVIAKSRFLNQNLMINPFNTTRNCKPSDHAAELLGNIVEYANFDTGGALDEIVEFQESMSKLVDELSGVIALANKPHGPDGIPPAALSSLLDNWFHGFRKLGQPPLSGHHHLHLARTRVQ